MDIIKFGSNTWLNVGVVLMVQKRDSYTRIWFVDGDYKDITGEWEKNMVRFLDTASENAKRDTEKTDGAKCHAAPKREPESILDMLIFNHDVGFNPNGRVRSLVIANRGTFKTSRDFYKLNRKQYMKYRGFGKCSFDNLNESLAVIGLPEIK